MGLLLPLAGGLIYLLAWENPHWYADFRLVKRNFYGVVRVEDAEGTADTEPMRELHHGTISHGTEYLNAPFHRRPTTYYGPVSGIGIALKDEPGVPPRRVAVIGLGAGTISAYARPGDLFRFYEINPEVVDIARTQFFYLKECPARWEVALGDARLSLEREQPQGFDVMAVDAFFGGRDSRPPAHYRGFSGVFSTLGARWRAGVHVSNRFLKLGGVVSRAANELHKSAILIVNEDDNKTALTRLIGSC